MGLGYYFRGATEHILFAVKGKLPRLKKNIINVVDEGTAVYEINSRKHSEKPNVFKDIIISHSGDLPRIELFARQKTEGWDAWGNEV
jgi:N6-adenosine-specific RNA methylase IME4